jgi:hypothetical protein
MTSDTEPHAELREELDDLFALVHALPPDETIRVRADRVRHICDLFAQVMDDAVELTEHNRSLENTVKVGDRIIGRLSGIDTQKEII